MARGKKRLYYDLFNQADLEPVKKRNHYIHKRNKALVHRYYFHAIKCRKRFEDALEDLSEQEFFISETRIAAILQEDEPYTLLKQLSEQEPDLKELANRYPQWSWKY